MEPSRARGMPDVLAGDRTTPVHVEGKDARCPVRKSETAKCQRGYRLIQPHDLLDVERTAASPNRKHPKRISIVRDRDDDRTRIEHRDPSSAIGTKLLIRNVRFQGRSWKLSGRDKTSRNRRS